MSRHAPLCSRLPFVSLPPARSTGMKSLVSVGVGSWSCWGCGALDRDDTLEARQAPSAKAALSPRRPKPAIARVAVRRGPFSRAPLVRPSATILAPADLNEIVKKKLRQLPQRSRRMGNLCERVVRTATSCHLADHRREDDRQAAHGMIPPPGPRPAGDTLLVLTETLERRCRRYAANPNPGSSAFQRLNRAE